MDLSSLNFNTLSPESDLAAWFQPEPSSPACSLLPGFPMGALPDLQVDSEAVPPGEERVEREFPEFWPSGSLNTGAPASDPLTGIGEPWLPERHGPFIDVAPWDLPDTSGWPDLAEQGDPSRPVDPMIWPPYAWIRGDRPISDAQPPLIEGDPLIDGPGLVDFPILSPNPSRPPSDFIHWVVPPFEDQPGLPDWSPLTDDFDARENVPSYRAYQEFLQQNPGWREAFSQGLLTIQVEIQSFYEPTVWLGNPVAARAFDAWYEQYWIPRTTPAPSLPGQDQPLPAPGQTPELLPPGLPIDDLIIRVPARDDTGSHPLYRAFTNFLAKNPGWLIEQGGEIGTCALTQSRHVASIWLSGSQEALAFDAWYERLLPQEFDSPEDSRDQGPIDPALAPGEIDPGAAGPCFPPPFVICFPVPFPQIPILNPTAPPHHPATSPSFPGEPLSTDSGLDWNELQDLEAPPVVEPTATVSDGFSSELKQLGHRSLASLPDRLAALSALTPGHDGMARLATDLLSLNPVRPRSSWVDPLDQLWPPRKSLDLPDWLPLHLRG